MTVRLKDISEVWRRLTLVNVQNLETGNVVSLE